MNEQLKPCQCGGNALAGPGKNCASIRCEACGMQVRIGYVRQSYEWAMEKAIAAWNTRPEYDRLRAENERLREELTAASEAINVAAGGRCCSVCKHDCIGYEDAPVCASFIWRGITDPSQTSHD